jgi:hypothetical protein
MTDFIEPCVVTSPDETVVIIFARIGLLKVKQYLAKRLSDILVLQ